MKVHANAPLGPKGRKTMVLRVLEQGWSLTEAAEAAGVSEHLLEVGRALPADGITPEVLGIRRPGLGHREHPSCRA